MKRAMGKVLACAIVLAIVLSAMSCALAAAYPSKAFRLPAVRVRPTEAPVEESAGETVEGTIEESAGELTEETIEESAGEAVEESTGESAGETVEETIEESAGGAVEESGGERIGGAVEETAGEATEEPAGELVEEAVEESAGGSGLRYAFERDAEGRLVLDGQGNPIAIVPDGMELPLTYLRDADGKLVLDENGDPIVKDTVPADAEKLLTLEDQLNPDRYMDVYISWKDGRKEIGNEAILVAVLYGYDNLVYTLQWQNSKDDANWTDVPGATDARLCVVATEENACDFWRVQVIITDVLD